VAKDRDEPAIIPPSSSISKERADSQDSRATARTGDDANAPSTRVTLGPVAEIPGHHGTSAPEPSNPRRHPARGARTPGEARLASWHAPRVSPETFAPHEQEKVGAGEGKGAHAGASWGEGEPPKGKA
jgi:hypothetical protein